MQRREFLGFACACCAAGWGSIARAQSESAAAPGSVADWKVPAKFTRPDIATDEGGLWALMDREETRMRRSPFLIRDQALRDYVQSVACRLGAEHCPDIRVYVMHTPMFNASMAPNGMMQVWSGLLLRVENEAQLAAVLGHEIGHYLERHSIEKLRDAKSRLAFGQMLGLLGLVGAVGQLAMLAGLLGYSRDQERAADRIGLQLMHRAGYDTGEAVKIWDNLLVELKARPDGDPAKNSPLFASHPPAEERRETLARLAAQYPGGVSNEQALLDVIQPMRFDWIVDEIKRSQADESMALFTRMLAHKAQQPDVLFARGETQRLRAKGGDMEAAVSDYLAAAAAGGEPPETHRGLGMIYRSRGQAADEKASFARYLEMAPGAPDAAMIKSYVEELNG